MTTETIEKPKRQWTEAQKQAAKDRWAAKRQGKAIAPVQKQDSKAQIESDCRAAFERVWNHVTKNGTENEVGKDEKTQEPIIRISPMDSFRIESVEGYTRASWRCGWNDVDDPSKVAKPILVGYSWANLPDDIEVRRAFDPTRPRSEITFEVYWEK